MAEVEFLLPTVQYGNVKVRATPEELGLADLDAGGLGAAYAVFLNLFTQGFHKGSEIDVEWTGSDTAALPRDVLERAQEAITEALGATEIPDPEDWVDPDGPETSDDAPWKQQVDSKPKPWETGSAPEQTSTAPAVANINW